MSEETTRVRRIITKPTNKSPKEDDFENNTRPRIKSKKKFWISGFIIIFLLAIGGGLYYQHYQNSPTGKEAKVKAETAALIKEVSKYMILPADDQPAIFDITDPAQLSAQQAFFADAIQGDKLLVYSKTAKAIIYSPSRKLIVNVGPVTFDQDTAGAKVIESILTPVAETEE